MKNTFNSLIKNLTFLVITLLLFIIIISGCGTYIPEPIDQTTIPAAQEPVYQKKIVINELAGWNTNLLEDEDSDYSDWVELYNTSPEPVNIRGWYLSDDRTILNKWMFSATKILNPGEHLIIFLSGKDKRTGRGKSNFHTNFTIENAQETLFLTSSDRIIQDTLEAQTPVSNTTIGRYADGISSWVQFDIPTPGESNSLVIPTPGLSLASGFYTSDKPLKISPNEIPEGYELRYTINDGIDIDELDQALNRSEWIYPSNKTGELYKQPISIGKTSVVKARFYKGLSAGPEVVYTYFINEDIRIPIISLTTDPANLWSPETGIYVTGNDPDNPNYLQEEWEIPARFTYFTSSSRQEPDIDVNCQLRIFGSATRAFPNKSLAIISRDREITNLFFDNNSETVYSLLLRTGASDFPRAIMRDIVTSEMVTPLNLDKQDYQQSLLFINGQFWGISNIREKINEEMIEDTYQINPAKLDMIFGTYISDARNGTVDSYTKMLEFMTKSNFYLDKYYNQAGDYIDIDSFIEYVIVETFINNGDWPANNVKAWKSWKTGSLWRWILYDTDASYDTVEFWSSTNPYDNKVIGRPDFNSISRIIEFDTSIHIVQIFQNLMHNQSFKETFINRYEELIGARDGVIINPDALLGTKRLLGIIETLSANIEPYIPRQLTRWLPEYPSYMRSAASDKNDTSINRWYQQVSVLKDFATQRPSFVAQFLKELNTAGSTTGINLVENGGFEQNESFWNLRWDQELAAQDIIFEADNAVGRIIIAETYKPQNDESDIIAFVQDGIELKRGSKYELTFDIRCGQPIQKRETILAYLFKSSPNYTLYTQLELTPDIEWQTVKKNFTMSNITDADARLQFRIGKLPPGTVLYIDNISLMEQE